jgi:hypothetical protein
MSEFTLQYRRGEASQVGKTIPQLQFSDLILMGVCPDISVDLKIVKGPMRLFDTSQHTTPINVLDGASILFEIGKTMVKHEKPAKSNNDYCDQRN